MRPSCLRVLTGAAALASILFATPAADAAGAPTGTAAVPPPPAAARESGDAGSPIRVHILGPSTIPFDSPSGLVIMTARLNGESHVRLLLDTGDPSGFTLDTATARSIGLPLSQRTPTRATGVVGSERYTLYRAFVRSFLLGGLSAHDLSIWTAPDAVLIAKTIGIHVDGFVGVDLLRGLSVTINYPARQITFSSPTGESRPKPVDGTGMPMRLEGNRIVFDAMLNDTETRAVILDTAAGTTFIAESDLPLTRPAPAGRSTEIVDSSGTAVSVPLRILPRLRLGQSVLQDVPVVPYDFEALNRDLFASTLHPVAGIIGSDILSRHVITLDFPGRLLLVAPGSPPK
jgi:Aspartyl protease